MPGIYGRSELGDRLGHAKMALEMPHILTVREKDRTIEWHQANIMLAGIRRKRKYGLPHLRPVDVRHWVASSCRKVGLSKQATAALMGHDPTQGGAMCDSYDNPQAADYLDEQALRLPNGPLGMLDPPAIEIAESMPPEALNLVAEYWQAKIGTLEFATKMETLRLQKAASVASVET